MSIRGWLSSQFGFLRCVLFGLIVVLVSSACHGGQPSETATLQLRVKRHIGDGAGIEYSYPVRWRGQGPSGSGSGANSFDESETRQGYSGSGGDMMETKTFMSLRPGDWTFTVTFDGSNLMCEQTLTANMNLIVNFTVGKSGCGVGPLQTDFP